MMQNLWEIHGVSLNRQKRRSQVVKKCLDKSNKYILDIGCAEGFATSFIKKGAEIVVGAELNLDYLKIAKKRVPGVFFVNASIDFLPFKDKYFDGVTILEVLEHLPDDLQVRGIKEANRILKDRGTLVLSVPYREQRIFTTCIHCKKDTPLYGHLHSFDENMINSLLPRGIFTLIKKYNLPHLEIISCLNICQVVPLFTWIKLNNIFGKFNILRGYWVILKYLKS